MKHLYTRSASALFKAMLLVWLTAVGMVGMAMADGGETVDLHLHTESGKTIQFSAFRPDAPSGDLDPQRPQADTPPGDDTPCHRADLYTLTKLAVDELEFLAGIRVFWDQTEKRFDRWAQKLKLKGDISIGGGSGSSGADAAIVDGFALRSYTARPIASRPTLSLRSIFIPHKVRWKMGFDISDQVVFGALEWGHFIALQSDVGAHQEVKIIFQCPF
jgi:hypothetical protein